MSNLTKQQRLATIDLVVPKNNQQVTDAMFSIIITQPWAYDLMDAVEDAMEIDLDRFVNGEDDLDY